MRRIAKKYHPDRRIIVHSRAEIPTHFASEEAEREWWATHELADELALSEAEIDRMTEQHHALVRRLQKNGTQRDSRHPGAKRT
jgi:hypothetical protein